MPTETRKITLTQYNNLSGPAYSVEYSTDCITYSQSMDCTNLFLPSVGSFGFCTVDDQTTCIRLTSITAPCTNSVVEDLRPTTTTTTTTSTTTTAAPTTTTTSTTSTTTTAAPTTTTTAGPTTTTTTTLNPIGCYEWTLACFGPTGCLAAWTDCNGNNQSITIADGNSGSICARPTPTISSGSVTLLGNCPTTTTTTTTTAAPTTTTTTAAPTTTTTTSTTTTTTSTTTTTTAAPTTTTTTIPSACYTLETVQSSQGECFDCPGYFASTTDTIMKIFTACSGSEILPPFDINVESRYSDNSTSSLFIPAGYTSSIIIATSDTQCVAPPTCGEIASPTFVSASITSTTGSITECCVSTTTTTLPPS